MSTEKLLQTMIKQGYIDKVQDTASGEPRHDFHLGPRGKVEVGKQGTLDFIKKVLKKGILLTIGVR
jgi:melanoma-associated antigen